MADIEPEELARPSLQHRIAERISCFVGSMQFIGITTLQILVWMLVESSPWQVLTLVLSIEAIYLTTFVLISENRESALSKARAEADLETNIRTTVLLEMVARALDLDPARLEEEIERRYQEADPAQE